MTRGHLSRMGFTQNIPAQFLYVITKKTVK